MKTWHIPEWTVTAALCGVLALGATDMFMMRRHHVTPHSHAIAGPPAVSDARPSPFERVRPEIVVVQHRRQPVEPVRMVSYETEPAILDRGEPSGILSKIPLLRRLQKHPTSGENLPQ